MAKTYKDIQAMTGLSLSTISKYFNGGALRDGNRSLIEQAIQKLDYRMNPFAQGLKSKKSRKVGVMIPELTSTYHTVVTSDVCFHLRQAGYDTVVCDAHLNRQIERDALDFLLDRMVDGIIIIPLDPTGESLAKARERRVPVVLIDRLLSGFKADAVIVDNANAGAMAAKALVERGHRRIGLITGLSEIYTMRERKRGFLSQLALAGVAHDETLTREIEFNIDGGYHSTLSLMGLANPPTALFTANYELMLGMIIALNELGARIGEDVSVVGFDNLQLARVIKPRLTMIKQPMEEITLEASRMMIERLEHTAPGIRVVELPTQLIEGESVKTI
jgi:LacI family transcriptional regulator